MKTDLNIKLSFRLQRSELPSVEEQYGWLWKLALSLDKAGLSLGNWYPPADTPKSSLLNKAFDSSGPTKAAIAIAEADTDRYPGLRGLGAWNGIEGPGGAVMTDLVSVAGLSICEVDSQGITGLSNPAIVLKIIEDMIRIWPASSVQVGPSRYFSKHQIFENRPGVGWMLYLPHAINGAQVPEARDLVPVMEGKHQTGTIILSVIDEAFSVDNPEHVAVANAIEVRLVDQDLLPLFTDL